MTAHYKSAATWIVLGIEGGAAMMTCFRRRGSQSSLRQTEKLLIKIRQHAIIRVRIIVKRCHSVILPTK